MDKHNSDASTSFTLHKLLYYALIDIRHEAKLLESGPVHGLADLFHILPLQLERAAKGEISYSTAYEELLASARKKGCEKWINDHLEIE